MRERVLDDWNGSEREHDVVVLYAWSRVAGPGASLRRTATRRTLRLCASARVVSAQSGNLATWIERPPSDELDIAKPQALRPMRKSNPFL